MATNESLGKMADSLLPDGYALRRMTRDEFIGLGPGDEVVWEVTRHSDGSGLVLKGTVDGYPFAGSETLYAVVTCVLDPLLDGGLWSAARADDDVQPGTVKNLSISSLRVVEYPEN